MDEQITEPQQQSETSGADLVDIEKNKVMGILAYILFLIPMLAAKESKFAMYHANQGLVLFLCMVTISIAGGVIPIIGHLLIPLGQLGGLILIVMGIINASKGEMKPLPLIGGITLLK